MRVTAISARVDDGTTRSAREALAAGSYERRLRTRILLAPELTPIRIFVVLACLIRERPNHRGTVPILHFLLTDLEALIPRFA